MWTIDELVDRVGAALAAEYPGAPNGRVRDLPDRRAVRWYTTTGLVDRPTTRGRTAYYGPRHLLQLVALKRRQAAGRSLAEIQAELTGATDQLLMDVARLPPEAVTPENQPFGGHVAARTLFWADRGETAAVPAAGAPDDSRAELTDGMTGAAVLSKSRPDALIADPGPAVAAAVPLAGVGLGGGVVLLLPGKPESGDYAAIAAAARPLLDLLDGRGLTDNAPSTHPAARRATRPSTGSSTRPSTAGAHAPRTDRSSS